MPTPFEGSYLTCRATAEAAATPRTLRAILEAVLDITFPAAALARSITIYNESAASCFTSHTNGSTHYMTYASGEKRQLVDAGDRVPLDAVYLRVSNNNDIVAIEVIVE